MNNLPMSGQEANYQAAKCMARICGLHWRTRELYSKGVDIGSISVFFRSRFLFMTTLSRTDSEALVEELLDEK